MPKFEEIRLFDLNKKRAEDWQKSLKTRSRFMLLTASQEAFKDADIVTTQTTAHKPIVKDEWVPKGSYYAHMAPYEGEDAAFVNTDRLVVDNWATLKTWDFFTPTRMVKEGLISE